MVLFFSMVLFLGCTMTSATGKNIDVLDGIGREEAKIIAKKELLRLNLDGGIKRNPSKIYASSEVKYSNKKIDSDIYLYDVFENNGNSKFRNSWFVMFKPKFISINTGFLAIIDKENGEVMYTQSGDFIEGMAVPLFKKKVKNHEKYMKAVIRYHKENKQWPTKIDEIKSSMDIPNEDINNLTITVKNEQKITLFFKDVFWSYVIKFIDNDYNVKFSAPQIKPNDLQDSIKKMLDRINGVCAK